MLMMEAIGNRCLLQFGIQSCFISHVTADARREAFVNEKLLPIV